MVILETEKNSIGIPALLAAYKRGNSCYSNGNAMKIK